jgi:predicted SAM-dependent methyltransferase
VAINLGCGASTCPGWINVDNSPAARLANYPWLRTLAYRAGVLSRRQYEIPWPKGVIVHDLRKPLPFATGSADYVYASHILEHFHPEEGAALLTEVCRILKPGGLARVVVPDLTYGVHRYLDELRSPGSGEAASAFLSWMQMVGRGRRHAHRWMYDAPSLTALMKRCGFAAVRVCEHQRGEMPDLTHLDNRREESLRVEATRPAR